MAWEYLTEMSVGWIDHSRERTTSSFYLADIAAPATADLDAEVMDPHDAVKAALAAVSLCNFTTSKVTIGKDEDTPLTPASPYAQREIGLWVQWVDTVNQNLGTTVIPGPDLTLLAQTATDEVDITANVAALALSAVLEANCASRDGNPIQITRMRIVGRSN